MKKIICVIAAMIMCFCFSACGEENIEVANPLNEVTADEMLQQTGFTMNIPQTAKNVTYFIIENEDTPTAQAIFTLNEQEYTYRMCSATEYSDISGLYYDWANVIEWPVGSCTGHVCYNADGAGYCGWYDQVTGVLYNVSVDKNATSSLLSDIALLLYEPLQGEV